MSELQFYTFNKEDAENHVRVKTIDDEPWFCAKDVCDALEIKNVSQATSTLKNEQVTSICNTYSGRHITKMNFISEAGLFKLIFKSRTEEASRFQDWVTEEVLPSIRKTGRYSLPDTAKSIEWDKEKYRIELARFILTDACLNSDHQMKLYSKELICNALKGKSEKPIHLKDLTTLMQDMGYSALTIQMNRVRLGKIIKRLYKETFNIEPEYTLKHVNGADRNVLSYPPEHYDQIKEWIRSNLKEKTIDSYIK